MGLQRQVDTSTAITRTFVPSLDAILGHQLPVLDYGFIRVIDYLGDDHAIDEAARTSYGTGTKRINAAQGLINTLMRDRHTSPFEMCEIKLHVKLPIFVMRQWVRHRMASLNEYSARYSVLKDEFYLPQLEDLMHQSVDNKQGRAVALNETTAHFVQGSMKEHSEKSYVFYDNLLKDDIDLTRELARINLPTSIYTEMYWKIDLHNLLHFLMLRNDSHAQKEIRDYAEVIQGLVADWVPMAHSAFKTYRQDAISFSGVEIPLVRWALPLHKVLDPEIKPTHADALSIREWKSFIEKIKRIA